MDAITGGRVSTAANGFDFRDGNGDVALGKTDGAAAGAPDSSVGQSLNGARPGHKEQRRPSLAEAVETPIIEAVLPKFRVARQSSILKKQGDNLLGSVPVISSSKLRQGTAQTSLDATNPSKASEDIELIHDVGPWTGVADERKLHSNPLAQGIHPTQSLRLTLVHCTYLILYSLHKTQTVERISQSLHRPGGVRKVSVSPSLMTLHQLIVHLGVKQALNIMTCSRISI